MCTFDSLLVYLCVILAEFLLNICALLAQFWHDFWPNFGLVLVHILSYCTFVHLTGFIFTLCKIGDTLSYRIVHMVVFQTRFSPLLIRPFFKINGIVAPLKFDFLCKEKRGKSENSFHEPNCKRSHSMYALNETFLR